MLGYPGDVMPERLESASRSATSALAIASATIRKVLVCVQQLGRREEGDDLMT